MPDLLSRQHALTTPETGTLRSPELDRAADLAARAIIGGLFLFFAVQIGVDFLETRRLTGLLLLLSELLVVLLTIIRRPAACVDRSLKTRAVAALSIAGPPLLRPGAPEVGMPDPVTAALSACGLLIVVFGKLSLGRSFGLMPAHRGIVSTGPYQYVRHPIYLGYLVTHVGFVCANPTAWNLLVLSVADLALLVRAGYEERMLLLDASYVSYRSQVRWRVVPGLY